MTGPFTSEDNGYIPNGQALPFTDQFPERPRGDDRRRARFGSRPSSTPASTRSTFRLGDIQIGDIDIQIPSNLALFQGDFDFTSSNGYHRARERGRRPADGRRDLADRGDQPGDRAGDHQPRPRDCCRPTTPRAPVPATSPTRSSPTRSAPTGSTDQRDGDSHSSTPRRRRTTAPLDVHARLGRPRRPQLTVTQIGSSPNYQVHVEQHRRRRRLGRRLRDAVRLRGRRRIPDLAEPGDAWPRAR